MSSFDSNKFLSYSRFLNTKEKKQSREQFISLDNSEYHTIEEMRRYTCIIV